MRITRYRFPEAMSERECYEAWYKGSEDYEPIPDDVPDSQITGYTEQVCSVSMAKKYLRKYGGAAWTEHYDRDGGCFEVTPIHAKGSNAGTAYGVKYNQHL